MAKVSMTVNGKAVEKEVEDRTLLVELLREKKPDLIIMDIRMPEKNGIEGLQEIRDIDPFVSIVMLTGYGDLETRMIIFKSRLIPTKFKRL